MSRMKRYQNPDLYEQLAAEYVMGSLKGRARARFETLMHQRPYIKYSVELWEERLHSLNEPMPEVQPSKELWQKINKSIAPQTQSKGSLLERLGFWQGATGLLSVALAVALVIPKGAVTSVPAPRGFAYEPTFVSVLATSRDKPMMYTTGLKEQGLVEVRMAEMPKIPENEDWVLWAIPKSGGTPVAVGTLLRDSMQTRFELTKEQWQKRMKGADVFGVTSEPRHSNDPMSPLQKPSGEIMYKGKCLEFI